MTKHVFLIALLAFIFVQSGARAQFYIAPNGNDNNPGTKKQPFESLCGAKTAIKEYKRSQLVNAPITVIVADGFYEMQKPFVLTSEDSGTENYAVIYKAAKGAQPLFSGGKKLKGFKVNQQGIWELKIPECTNSDWRFDQLYVNGKRAILARTPNKGFLKIGDIKQNIVEQGKGRVAEKAEQIISFDDENFSALNKFNNNEVDLIRFRAFHKWDFTLRFIDEIDKSSNAIYTSGKGMKPWNPLKKNGRIYFENYAAALDMEGEWFLSYEGVLYYFPLPGETPENSEVIIPQLENLITLKGDVTNEKFVESIQFEGLAFKHCHYRMPEAGSEPNQAAALVSSAIMLEGAKNIQFRNCEISKTGQHALWFGKGCSESIVEHCYLNDLGGGGIYLGDFSLNEESTHHIKIHNNIIHSGGKEFPSAVGVWVGHSSDNEISHNDIGNFYYTGISAGWIWGYKNSNAKRNKITYNCIHHIGWDLLSDMAAVYTLGKSEGTEISHNVIHHINAYSYGGWGLYTDEGSSGIIMENNLVYKTKTGGFHQHYGKENVIRNNIFAFAKLFQAQCTRVEEHRSFTFENNIVIFNQGVVLKGAWEKINITMNNNLYWNINEDKYDFNGKSFKDWQNTGHDSNSVIANPNFKDALSFNFEIANKNNINKINFIPFDFSKAGTYGKKQWKDKAKLPQSILDDFDKTVAKNLTQKTGRD